MFSVLDDSPMFRKQVRAQRSTLFLKVEYACRCTRPYAVLKRDLSAYSLLTSCPAFGVDRWQGWRTVPTICESGVRSFTKVAANTRQSLPPP